MSHKKAKKLRKEIYGDDSHRVKEYSTLYHTVPVKNKDGKVVLGSRGQVMLMCKRGEYQMRKRGTMPC